MISVKHIENFIKIAEEMMERNEMNTCINRLYVASENIAMMVLQKFATEFPKRHDKIANAIENLFKTGKIDKDFSGMMRRLYELHLLSDYGRETDEQPTKEELQNMLEEIREFVGVAKAI